ncbi:MAG TPA: hypothetical protein VHA56_02595 [Mucilaginibacter sp.]|nr:hypothetical protein [Mucilaginibacter sp.]
MFATLNASGYTYNKVFYHAEFEKILANVVTCYNQMLVDGVKLENNENKIRDVLLYRYLKCQKFKEKIGITDYLFDPELPEDSGRIDIRVMPVNPFINDKAYYIIECKRINAVNTGGTTGLNAQYISEGINRFVSEKYSSYFKVNGMIGFVVEPMDLTENIKSINDLLSNNFPQLNTTMTLTQRELLCGFGYSYCSTHTCSKGDLTIYHLMLDFSNNIS